MDSPLEKVVNPAARYDGTAALLAGLIAGAVMWLLSHGTPWFTSGMISPTLMGRDLKPPGAVDPSGSAFTTIAEMAVAVAYALALALVVTRFRGLWAIVAGGVAGVGLYLVNFAVFRYALGGSDSSSAELTVLVTHVAFCTVTAGLYKGLARRAASAPGEEARVR